MEIKKYKKEDAIELNERNVVLLYKDCLATDSTNDDNKTHTIFSPHSNMPIIAFDYNKIKLHSQKINYLLGQLFYSHHLSQMESEFGFSTGAVNYKKMPWTQNKNLLYFFYYLQRANNSLIPFDEKNETDYINRSEVIPTLSPADPNFEEWSKDHIEQGTSKKAGGVEPYDN